jgi:predicted anti-sigma-YlaC factor YlaD
MKCQELLGALNDYLDGDTRSALCRALQDHLADCESCRIVIDNIRQTITLYRAGETMPMPPGLHERVRSIVQQRWAATPRFAGRPR